MVSLPDEISLHMKYSALISAWSLCHLCLHRETTSVNVIYFLSTLSVVLRYLRANLAKEGVLRY